MITETNAESQSGKSGRLKTAFKIAASAATGIGGAYAIYAAFRSITHASDCTPSTVAGVMQGVATLLSVGLGDWIAAYKILSNPAVDSRYKACLENVGAVALSGVGFFMTGAAVYGAVHGSSADCPPSNFNTDRMATALLAAAGLGSLLGTYKMWRKPQRPSASVSISQKSGNDL